MGVFHQYTAVMDSLAKYDNLLGLVVGNEIVDKSEYWHTRHQMLEDSLTENR